MIFFHSLHSEWLKTRRSTSFWLCVIGGLFIPTMYLGLFLYKGTSINTYDLSVNIWISHFAGCWHNMNLFLLPTGIILISSFITQIEYKNNTWKQLHTTPQSYTVIYFAKILVIVFMLIQFFLFFNIGIIISGILPSLLFDSKWPVHKFPVEYFVKQNFKYFIACLPIIATQYLVSLRFKNFITPIGIGIIGFVGTIILIGSKYNYLSPYTYNFLAPEEKPKLENIELLALIYFLVFIIINYFVYLFRRDKV